MAPAYAGAIVVHLVDQWNSSVRRQLPVEVVLGFLADGWTRPMMVVSPLLSMLGIRSQEDTGPPVFYLRRSEVHGPHDFASI